MRFMVDENLPIDVAEILRANNHDAMTIFDQEMVGQSDLKVASVCRAEERALVTLDLDFSDIRTYPPAAHAGIIILRPRTQSKPDVLALLGRLLPLLRVHALYKMRFPISRRQPQLSRLGYLG